MKKLRNNKHYSSGDRISELPEPILHHILSFLPNKDATKTCVLSKTWKSLWNSFPVLEFDQDNYCFASRSGGKKSVEDFCNYVDNSIARRRTDISIQKLKLDLYFNHTGLKSRWRDLERWLGYAVSNNAENLLLYYHKNTSSKKAWPYLLPMSTLYRAKSLKELDLFGCKFVETHQVIGFSLIKLKLEEVFIDDRTFQCLLSNCCSLEELNIDQCDGFQSISLSGSKLERVHLALNEFQIQKVAIHAPNLQCLSYGGRHYANILSSLEASNINKNLKELRFDGVTITDAIIRLIREFRALDKFELTWCFFLMDNIQISSYRPSSELSDTIRLENVELVANCVNCCIKNNGGDIPPGLYKLGIIN